METKLINNQIYLNISTLGHITNDPEANIYFNDGKLNINKKVLLNLKQNGWDNQTLNLLNDEKTPDECVLMRLMNKGPGWFYILNR